MQSFLVAGGYCPFLERKGPKELPKVLSHFKAIRVTRFFVWVGGDTFLTGAWSDSKLYRARKKEHPQRNKVNTVPR